MAELPHIGQQCSSCKRLDFLPVICLYCKNVFCKDHLSTEIHQCADFASSDRIVIDVPEKSDYERCDFCSVIVKNRLEMVKCDGCQLKFCLTHRHPEGHKCSTSDVKAVETPSAYQLIASASASLGLAMNKPSGVGKGAKGAKNETLTKKVALMKLKQTAIGLQLIPQSERIYFNLDLSNQRSKPIYLSTFWSIGKAIDFISSKFNLTNNNNKPDQPKLVIATATETSLPFDSSVSSLIDQGFLENGQTIFIKYIEPSKS